MTARTKCLTAANRGATAACLSAANSDIVSSASRSAVLCCCSMHLYLTLSAVFAMPWAPQHCAACCVGWVLDIHSCTAMHAVARSKVTAVHAPCALQVYGLLLRMWLRPGVQGSVQGSVLLSVGEGQREESGKGNVPKAEENSQRDKACQWGERVATR